MTIKALIFDVDGTLAETEELHRHAFNDAFAHFGENWNWSREDYHWLLKTTGGKERMRAFADKMGQQISSDKIAEIHVWKTARYAALMASGALSLREGIAELIERARLEGYKIAVATTTSAPNVEALCQACFGKPMAEVFDAIAAGDMVQKKKPAPDVYLLALEKLELLPNECIAFEDTLNGVRSAKAANLQVILSQSAYSSGEATGGAEYVLDSFEQAMEIFGWNEIQRAI